MKTINIDNPLNKVTIDRGFSIYPTPIKGNTTNGIGYIKNKKAILVSNQLVMNRIMLNSKRSQGHVEMILSFVLFISAIIFIFFYINPFSKTIDNGNEIEQVQRIIMKNISVKAGRLTIASYVDPINNPDGCYDFAALEYPSVNYVEILETTPGTDKKYTIYFSDSFPTINPNHRIPSCSANNYKLGAYSKETIILYDLLENLATISNTDIGYKKIKEDLGINMDFIINSTDLNRNYISELSFRRRVPTGVKIDSKELPIRLIKNDGTMLDVIFNLRVW